MIDDDDIYRRFRRQRRSARALLIPTLSRRIPLSSFAGEICWRGRRCRRRRRRHAHARDVKKEGNHKRAQKEKKKECAKGTKRKRKTAKKKVSKIGLLLWCPKVLKISKNKKQNFGVLSFKIKARRPTTLIKANKNAGVTKEREREREDGTAA